LGNAPPDPLVVRKGVWGSEDRQRGNGEENGGKMDRRGDQREDGVMVGVDTTDDLSSI